jgi:hypothetical protein
VRLSRRAFVRAGGACLAAALAVDGDRPAEAEPTPAPDDLLARISRARASVRTLQGPFTQTRSIGLLATEVRSQGVLTLVRPDRLRWELAAPDDVTFWVTPEGLAYRSAHGQGRVSPSAARAGGALDDLRTLLGGDLSRLRDRWDLRVARDNATGAEIEATPRAGTAGALRSSRLALTPDLARPTRAVLVEGPRDKTVIEFGALVVNAPVDDARMRP